MAVKVLSWPAAKNVIVLLLTAESKRSSLVSGSGTVNVREAVSHDVTEPRVAVYKTSWRIHQNTVYCINLRDAQKKGLTLYQTKSNAIILHNTLPAACIEKVVVMNSEEVLYHKIYESPR